MPGYEGTELTDPHEGPTPVMDSPVARPAVEVDLHAASAVARKRRGALSSKA